MESSQQILVSALYEELNYQAEIRNTSITALPEELLHNIVNRHSLQEWIFFWERHQDIAVELTNIFIPF